MHVRPEITLFTDKDGNGSSLEDLIADGLEGEYDDRIPDLDRLVETADPYHKLMACIVLTSWGHPKGFQKICEWSSNIEGSPWANSPVTVDRIYGVDDSYEQLSDAIRNSYWLEENQELRRDQRRASKALLGIYSEVLFGRTLALTLLRDDYWMDEGSEIIERTAKTSIEQIEKSEESPFDLAFQTACLLYVIVKFDDEAAAEIASKLIGLQPENNRMTLEIIDALRGASGPRTIHVLEHIEKIGPDKARLEASKAIQKRENLSPS